ADVQQSGKNPGAGEGRCARGRARACDHRERRVVGRVFADQAGKVGSPLGSGVEDSSALLPAGPDRRKLARPEGLEPPAYWFEASRSIRLSYGRIASS